MKTYIRQRSSSSQAFSNNIEAIKSNVMELLYHNDLYNTFGNPILGKLLSCNVTMDHLEMSHTWIATQVGSRSRKTSERWINQWVATGLLRKDKRYHGKGKEQTNRYTFHPYAKTQEFLQLVAPRFHEIRLYIKRNAKDLLRKSLDHVSKTVQKVGCAFTALFNGGVPLFNSPPSNSYFYLIRQYQTVKNQKALPEKGSMEDFRTSALAKVEKKAGLTPAGAIALAGYSDKVLIEAHRQYSIQKGRINKPFYWLSHVCKQISVTYKERFDYRKMHLLQQMYGIDDKAAKTETALQLQRLNKTVVEVPQISTEPVTVTINLTFEQRELALKNAKRFMSPEGYESMRRTLCPE